MSGTGPLAPLSRLLSVIASVLFSAAVALPPGSATAAAPPHLSVKGRQILTPDGRPIVLRGFNILWWTKPSAQDAVEIRKLGGNCVRYMFGYHPKGKYDPSQLKELETHVRYFTGQGIWVIPTVHQVVKKEGEAQLAPWDSPEIEHEFLDLWTDVIKRLKGDPFIAAWEPMNEPHSYTRELTTATLRAWYGEVSAHLRRLDPERPLVLEGDHYSYARNLGAYLKTDDPNVIYSFHVYNPFNYTHQKSEKDGTPPAYPTPGK